MAETEQERLARLLMMPERNPAQPPQALIDALIPHLASQSTYAPLPPPSMEANAAGKVPAIDSDPRMQGAAADVANAAQNFIPFGGPVAGGAKAAIPLLGAALARRLAPTAEKAAVEVAPQGIRAYHGSPHDFDRFDLGKIGTGEGAQAYGHGLYFAENPETAQIYRDKLSDSIWQLKPESRTPTNQAMAQEIIHLTGVASPQEAVAALKDKVRQYHGYTQEPMISDEKLRAYQNAALKYQDMLDWVLENRGNLTNGRMYEVNINAKPEQFLDWDKPVQQQAETVKRFVGKPSDMFPESMTGAEMYRMLGRGMEPKVSASLNEAGIPGIRYLDQGSRGVGEGSRNIVVFDDKLIDILRKYGLAGAAPIPAAALADALRKQGADATQ